MYSGKDKCHCIKTLSVVDRDGFFMWIETNFDGRLSDLDMFQSSPLYLNAGQYFTEGEFIASDGIFMDVGNTVTSFRNIANDACRAAFNACFNSFRIGVENAFGRQQQWYPILGYRREYWTYARELLVLVIHATARLHNWKMAEEGLNYNALLDPNNVFMAAY